MVSRKKPLSKKFFVSVFLMVSVASPQSYAGLFGGGGCCLDGPASNALSTAQSSILAKIAEMQAETTAQIQMLNANTVKGYEGIRTTLSKQNEALTTEEIEQQRILEQQKTLYESRRKLEEDYGEPPVTVCQDAAQAAVTQNRRTVGKQAAEAAAHEAKNRRTGKDKNGRPIATPDAVADLNAIPVDKFDIEKVMTDKNLSDEERKKLYSRVVDPIPPETISEEMKKTATGKAYEATLREYSTNMSAVQSVLDLTYAYRTPINGKPSEEDTIKAAVVESGWSSPLFHAEVQQLGRTDAIRSAIKQQALRNYLLFKRYELRLKAATAKAILIRDALTAMRDQKLAALKQSMYKR